MSPEAIKAQIERDQAQRNAALWAKPLLSDVEAAAVLGLPASTWHLLKRAKNFPPTFTIGGKRRVYIRTADLQAWVDAQAPRAAA